MTRDCSNLRRVALHVQFRVSQSSLTSAGVSDISPRSHCYADALRTASREFAAPASGPRFAFAGNQYGQVERILDVHDLSRRGLLKATATAGVGAIALPGIAA